MDKELYMKYLDETKNSIASLNTKDASSVLAALSLRCIGEILIDINDTLRAINNNFCESLNEIDGRTDGRI